MHFHIACRVKYICARTRARLSGQTKKQRRNSLLLDRPDFRQPAGQHPSWRSPPCHDAVRRGVPYAKEPVWHKGAIALPVAKVRVNNQPAQRHAGVGLPTELWQNISKHLSDDVGSLTALRATSRFFARHIDTFHADIFTARVYQEFCNGGLSKLPQRTCDTLFGKVEELNLSLARHPKLVRKTSLQQLLSAMQQLQRLDLTYSALNDPTAAHIAWPPALQQVDLTGNELHDIGAWLGHLPPTVTSLRLNLNGLQPLPGLAWPQALQHLEMTGTQLSDDSDLDLRQFTELRTLDLSYNQFRTGARLQLPTGLTHLFLAYNELQALPFLQPENMQTLVCLQLQGNLLTDAQLAPLLLPTPLQTLNLSNNLLQRPGVQLLLPKTFEDLQLSGNTGLDQDDEAALDLRNARRRQQLQAVLHTSDLAPRRFRRSL